MNSITIIGWELRRILLTRSYLYSLLAILLVAQNALDRLIIYGVHGAAPYAPISFAQYLVLLNPMLMAMLMLWCAAVFSEKQRAVLRIILSTPTSLAAYLGIQTTAMATAFGLTSAAMVILCMIFYGWQFGVHAYGTFVGPLLAFWLPAAIFTLGLALAAGHWHRHLPYGLAGIVFLLGFANMGLPVWLDICGNNFLLDYPKILMRTFGTGEMIYRAMQFTLVIILLHNARFACFEIYFQNWSQINGLC